MAETEVEDPGGQPVAFFDGICNLCDGAVNFLIDHDPRAVLKFAPLQGSTFAALVETHPELAGIDSFVLWDAPRVYTRSSAGLHIAMALGWPWRALAVLLVIPRPLRDAVYDFVAQRRYRWYGRRESCRMPTPELRARFLD
jgi:predicted DCC family thiol-disulfide oxidoreductase YuxK